MLNRKLSNYIFYIILLGIVAVVFLLRSVMLGGIVSKTEALDRNNIELQSQIDNLEDIVQTNKNVQESRLYELYNEVPEKYSQTELTYLVISKLELAGIGEANDSNRSITLNPKVTFAGDSPFAQSVSQFDAVEIQVYFTVLDLTPVEALLDILNDSEQVFVVNYIDFITPDGEDAVGVNIHFLTFYKK